MSLTPALRFLPFAAVLIFAGECLAAPGGTSEPPRETNPTAIAAQMMIEAGRLGVMLDQADAAIMMHNGGQSPEEPVGTPAQQQIYAVHELRAAVLRFNVMQFDACRSGVVSGELCATPYVPDWLKEPQDTVPAPAVVLARVHDTLVHIMPFWKAMCAKAIAQTHDETFCSME